MSKQSLIVATLVFCSIELLLCTGKGFAQKNSWPQFRGPNCSGISDKNANPPLKFGEHNMIWKMPLPAGHSSPCIWENNIFITGFVEEEKELQLICINRNTGEVNWLQSVYPKEIEKVHNISNPAATTPVTDGEVICVYFGSHGLLCYDFDGKLLWESLAPPPASGMRYGVSSSPIIASGRVIFTRPYGDDPHILALQCADGDTLWKTSLPRAMEHSVDNKATPVVWRQQVVVHRVGEIVAHSLEDGKRIWWVRAPSTGVSTPVISDSALFVCTWHNLGAEELRVQLPEFETLVQNYDENNNGLIARSEIPRDLIAATRPETKGVMMGDVSVRYLFRFFDENKDKLLDEKEWVDGKKLLASYSEDHGILSITSGGVGNVTLSNISWKEKEKVPEVPSPVYHDDRVYMVKNGGIITCLNARNGEVIYRERLGVSGVYLASPIVARDMIYIPSLKGIITVIKTGDTLAILARNDLDEKIFATPAVIGDTLYVRTQEHLYAFTD